MSDSAASVSCRLKRFGMGSYRFRDSVKSMLYSGLKIRLPKLKRQRRYWEIRGQSYMHDFFRHGHAERELFFQNLLFESLRKLSFDSIFEAGCGFGWNIRRCRQEFPFSRVGGVDYSFTHLSVGARSYLQGIPLHIVHGDNCALPLAKNAFDVGFSLGVFMNIHQRDIEKALAEMIRVCRKRILHLEWNADHATGRLRDKREPKTNIISHDYETLYRRMGQDVLEVRDYRDFGPAYGAFIGTVQKPDSWWAGFDGVDKYTYYLIRVCK